MLHGHGSRLHLPGRRVKHHCCISFRMKSWFSSHLQNHHYETRIRHLEFENRELRAEVKRKRKFRRLNETLVFVVFRRFN